MEEKIEIWQVGNTGLRNPNRIQDGFRVFANSPYVGNLRKENEIDFMKFLNSQGIIQNEAGNKYSSTVIIAAITSQMHKAKLPTHVELDSRYCDIAKDSVILLEQVRTIDKQRLKEKVCHLDNTIIRRVNEALRISLEL